MKNLSKTSDSPVFIFENGKFPTCSLMNKIIVKLCSFLYAFNAQWKSANEKETDYRSCLKHQQVQFGLKFLCQNMYVFWNLSDPDFTSIITGAFTSSNNTLQPSNRHRKTKKTGRWLFLVFIKNNAKELWRQFGTTLLVQTQTCQQKYHSFFSRLYLYNWWTRE